jgi:hypothetical protein
MKKFPAQFIIGKWFHTFCAEEGKRQLKYQGVVEDYDPETGMALVRLFDWIDGRNVTGQKILEVTEDWQFYDTPEEHSEGAIDTLPYHEQEMARKVEAVYRFGATWDSL